MNATVPVLLSFVVLLVMVPETANDALWVGACTSRRFPLRWVSEVVR